VCSGGTGGSCDGVSSWLLGSAARRHVTVRDLLGAGAGSRLSVNSVDVLHNSLVAGTDAEQICVMSNLAIV